MIRLIPRDEKYFDLFNQMASQLVQAASELKKAFADFAEREKYAHEIKRIEHSCDEMIHNIVTKLNKSFITPIDREDIHTLASALDDVVDLIDSAITGIMLFRIEAPTESAKMMADVIHRATEELGRAVNTLGKKGMAEGLAHCRELHGLEKEGDVVYRQAMAQLFVNPTDPYFVIKWKDVYDRLETAIDNCETAANVIESIILKNA